jgi:hypothetical protein
MRPDPDELGPWSEGDRRVLDLLSTMDDHDLDRHEPPPGLWDSIAASLPDADEPTVLGVDGATTSAEPLGGEPAPAVVVDLEARRRQRRARLLAAAAVVVLAAGTFGAIAMDRTPSQELVASVELEALKARGSGEAELVTVDGEQRLVVRAADLGPSPEGTHYEMWMIDEGITDIRSLGELPDGVEEIEVPLPEGVDPDEFPIVDINVQQDDQEQHSGVDTSVLRGVLA